MRQDRLGLGEAIGGAAITWLGAIPLGLAALGLQRVGLHRASRSTMLASARLGDTGGRLLGRPSEFVAAIEHAERSDGGR